MKSTEIGWILQDMSQDFSFDQTIFAYLCKELFQPEMLIFELSQDDFEIFIKTIPKVALSYLYTNIPDFKNPIDSIFKNKKFLEKEDKKLSLEDVVQECITSVLTLVEESKISYNGIILYFYKLPCKKKKFIPVNLTFQILETINKVNDILLVIILSQELSGSVCKLKFEFSNKSVIYKEVRFDIWGLYYGEIFLESVEGFTIVTLYLEDKILYSKTILFTKYSKSLLQIKNLKLYQKDFLIFGEGLIDSKGIEIKDERIKFIVICPYCGSFLHFGYGKIEESIVQLSFPIPDKNLEHSTEYLIYFQYLENSFICSTKVIKSKLTSSTIYTNTRKSDENIEIPVNLDYGKSYFFMISQSENLLDTFKNNLEYRENFFPDFSRENRNFSAIELSLQKEEFKLFAKEKNDYRVFTKIISYPDEKFYIPSYHKENIESLFIDIYDVWEEFRYLYRIYSPISEELQIWSEKKMQIPGEESKVGIFLSQKNKKINIKKPREKKEFKYNEKYYIKYNENIELELDTNEYKIDKFDKKYEIRTYEFISDNEFGSNLSTFIRRDIEDNLLNLKEVNQDFVAILIYLYFRKYNANNEFRYLEEKISYLIKVAKNIQNNNKFKLITYSILEKINIDKYKYINKFPDLISFIEELSEKLNKIFYNSYEEYVYKNLYNYFQWKDLQLNLINSEHTSQELFLLILKYLLEKEMDELYVLSKKSIKIENKYSSGLKGIFEKIGIIDNSKKKKVIRKIKKITNAKEILIKLIQFKIDSPYRDKFRMFTLLEFMGNNVYSLKSSIATVERNDNLNVPQIFINKMKYQINEVGYIYSNVKDDMNLYLEIQFPAFLKILTNHHFHIKVNSIIVPFHYLSTSPIEFIPIIKGKGSIVYIVHNDNIQTIRELGILEVVD